jgi:hypothetical protein
MSDALLDFLKLVVALDGGSSPELCVACHRYDNCSSATSCTTPCLTAIHLPTVCSCACRYKLFGYPTGVGALILRKENVPLLRKVGAHMWQLTCQQGIFSFSFFLLLLMLLSL